jgi:predicted Holliday junction resolvase-like endonuclease
MLPEAKKLIRELKNSLDLAIECPSCRRKIPAPKADLFTEDALSQSALTYKSDCERRMSELKSEIHDLTIKKKDRIARTTLAVNIGFIIEKFAPVLRGFGYDPRDCRGIFEPIDYIVFHGAHRSEVSHLEFVDVKSGKAMLKPHQKAIGRVVKTGNISFQIMETGE